MIQFKRCEDSDNQNYADDTTPFVCASDNDTVLRTTLYWLSHFTIYVPLYNKNVSLLIPVTLCNKIAPLCNTSCPTV